MRRVVAGDMAQISDVIAPWVRQMIRRCWDLLPDSRSDFSGLLAELIDRQFQILPSANFQAIEAFIRWVQENANAAPVIVASGQ
jgi:hypothetical protein